MKLSAGDRYCPLSAGPISQRHSVSSISFCQFFLSTWAPHHATASLDCAPVPGRGARGTGVRRCVDSLLVVDACLHTGYTQCSPKTCSKVAERGGRRALLQNYGYGPTTGGECQDSPLKHHAGLLMQRQEGVAPCSQLWFQIGTWIEAGIHSRLLASSWVASSSRVPWKLGTDLGTNAAACMQAAPQAVAQELTLAPPQPPLKSCLHRHRQAPCPLPPLRLPSRPPLPLRPQQLVCVCCAEAVACMR